MTINDSLNQIAVAFLGTQQPGLLTIQLSAIDELYFVFSCGTKMTLASCQLLPEVDNEYAQKIAITQLLAEHVEACKCTYSKEMQERYV